MLENNIIIPDFDSEIDKSLKFTLTKISDEIIEVTCVGYIDTYNSNFFLKKLTMVSEKYACIILNLSGVDYISSTGIGALTTILRDCRNKNGDLVFINVGPKIYEIFQLLGFIQFFVIKSSVEAAKEYFTSGNLVYKFKPTSKKCPVCGTVLKINNPGRFRCANCRSILFVASNGNITLA